MESHHRLLRKLITTVSLSTIVVFLFSACNPFTQLSSEEPSAFVETIEDYPQAEVVFQVRLPKPISSDEKLILEILDDVTGTYFNASRFEMTQQDELGYFVRVPLIIGTRVKYRFLRQGTNSIYEYSTRNKMIDFRVLYVNGPSLVQDLISAWADVEYAGPVGRIRGQLMDELSGAPVPNMAINAAGMRTISASDGTFILEGLPVWTHNLVIYSLDGSYETFQQGAAVANEAITPVFINLHKRETVDVVFEVQLPENFKTDLPLKLASNIYPFGFPETELESGSSLVSANLPVFTKNESNVYTLSLSLPVGTDTRYKFTMGDGFWNAELNNLGGFVTRTLIVPSSNSTIRKNISTFHSPGSGEISFAVDIPDNTPINESVSLQLNPFGWMSPLQMVKTGDNQWSYTIYSPIHLVSSMDYRFCRNDQCAIARSSETNDGTVIVAPSSQTITETLETWVNLTSSNEVTNVDTGNGTTQPRTDFIAGFELDTNFYDSWSSYVDQGLQAINSTGANWVIISPTWSITNTNPPSIEPVPGQDLLWPELIDLTGRITNTGLHPVIFPQISPSVDIEQFWAEANRDTSWWESFFERYQRFILQNADLANQTGASAILVGDPVMQPAMSNGILSNGVSSNSPQNSDQRWSQLITDIRSRYNGPVVGVMAIPNGNTSLPEWYYQVDAIYVLFSPSHGTTSTQTVADFKSSFDAALETLVKPIAEKYNKPILIGLNTPSNQTSINGCVDRNGSCKSTDSIEIYEYPVDLDLQTKIYNAAILSTAERLWISGFISRMFNPLVVSKDQSSSVYGKPASDVIWFWYHFILNKPI